MSELMNQIEKRVPYRESEEYLDNLINHVTENALMRQSNCSFRWRKSTIISAAAAALLVIGIGFTILHDQSQDMELIMQADKGPIDEFLNTMTDEEVAMLPYYEIDEIPEY